MGTVEEAYEAEREHERGDQPRDPELSPGEGGEEIGDVSDPETGDVSGQHLDVEGQDGAGTPGAEDGVEEPAERGEVPAGMSERELERAFDKVEQAGAKWVAKVDEFRELTSQPLVRCAVCLPQCPGFHFHPDVLPLTDEQIAACKVLAGMPLEPSFQQDPESQTCGMCDGWGRVKTGSKVSGQTVAKCPNCNGYGYTTSRDRASEPAGQPAGGPPEPSAVLTDEEQAGEDAWGTPRTHPDWGKAPQYRSPSWQEDLQRFKAGQPAEAS